MRRLLATLDRIVRLLCTGDKNLQRLENGWFLLVLSFRGRGVETLGTCFARGGYNIVLGRCQRETRGIMVRSAVI